MSGRKAPGWKAPGGPPDTVARANKIIKHNKDEFSGCV